MAFRGLLSPVSNKQFCEYYSDCNSHYYNDDSHSSTPLQMHDAPALLWFLRLRGHPYCKTRSACFRAVGYARIHVNRFGIRVARHNVCNTSNTSSIDLSWIKSCWRKIRHSLAVCFVLFHESCPFRQNNFKHVLSF